MKKVAVIIPCYNASKTIGNTLLSVLNQSRSPDEIIVVDDGSTDDSGDIVHQFGGVRYHRQKNAGVSVARNMGVSLTTSQWVAFCDADDLWIPRKLEVCLKCIEDIPNCKFIFHDFYVFDESKLLAQSGTFPPNPIFGVFREQRFEIGEVLNSMRRMMNDDYVDQASKEIEIYAGNVFEWLILGNFVLPSTVLISRNTYLESKGFDPEFRSAEETEYFLRCAKFVDFVFINAPLAGYRSMQNSLSGNTLPLLERGLNALRKNCLDDRDVYRKHSSLVRRGMGRRYSKIAYFNLSEMRRFSSIENALKSLRYHPTDKRAWLCLGGGLMPEFILKLISKAKRYALDHWRIS